MKLSIAWDIIKSTLYISQDRNQEVTSANMSDEMNAALDTITSALIASYAQTSADLEEAIGSAMSKHWVKTDSNTKIPFNIPRTMWSVESIPTRHVDSKFIWPNFWTIQKNSLNCLGFNHRCICKLSALNKMFDVTSAEEKQLKMLFGTAYHGEILKCDRSIEVCSPTEHYRSINDICELLNEVTIKFADSDYWVYVYLKSYVDVLNRLRSQD